MSRIDALYNLLPSLYRRRDQELPELEQPLRALMSVLQRPADRLEQDILRLYHSWFVDSCEPHLLPHLARLVGAEALAGKLHPAINSRSLIGNAIHARRRKGTAEALRRAAEDATGWPALVHDGRDFLAATPTARRLTLDGARSVDMRDAQALLRLNGPYEKAAHYPDVRLTSPYGPGRAALWFWRLDAWPLADVEARQVGHGRCTLHPAGVDMPIMSFPGGSADRSGPAEPAERISRRRLKLDLRSGASDRYLRLMILERAAVDGAQSVTQVNPGAIAVGDLSGWAMPPGVPRITLDPELGRLLLPDDLAARVAARTASILTWHCQPATVPMGSGPYAREDIRLPAGSVEVALGGDGGLTRALAAIAVPSTALTVQPGPMPADVPFAKTVRMVEIGDSRTYDLPARIAVGKDEVLIIRAAKQTRPCLTGNTVLSGPPGAHVVLDGVMMNGRLTLEGGLHLRVQDCTLVPQTGRISLTWRRGKASDGVTAAHPRVEMARCITGPIRLPQTAAGLTLEDCVLDGAGQTALKGPVADDPGPPAVLRRVSVLGRLSARQLEASDTLFAEPVTVVKRDEGYVRFCVVPQGSSVPPRYRCLAPPEPLIRSRRFGQPDYARPDPSAGIGNAAADGHEIGAFHMSGDDARQDGLRIALDEYLPFHIDAVTRYAS